MSVTDDRRFTKAQIYAILENVKGKTLGEVDKSHQFDRTIKSEKITGIAGDVIEQSVLGYERDSNQECDIEIDGVLTELKTTGVRIPKSDLKNVRGKTGEAYNVYLGAKEGISITNVTFEPTIETDFNTSHFWEKSEHLLIVFMNINHMRLFQRHVMLNFLLSIIVIIHFQMKRKQNCKMIGKLCESICRKSITNSLMLIIAMNS